MVEDDQSFSNDLAIRVQAKPEPEKTYSGRIEPKHFGFGKEEISRQMSSWHQKDIFLLWVRIPAPYTGWTYFHIDLL